MKRVTWSLVFFFAMMTAAYGNNVKEPNVSGQFYDANPAKLSAAIDHFFSAADVAAVDKDALILFAPHAGYVYSGGVAAYGYKALSGKKYKTVIILAPSHFYGFDGVSVWKEGAFRTPLGLIDVDQDFAVQLLQQDGKFQFIPQAFDREHALEVQLPFVQKTFPDIKIVPVIVGQADYALCQKLADSLDRLIGGRKDVLVVVSSDMSHYHNDQTARDKDRKTIQCIEALKVEEYWQKTTSRELEMCGSHPATAALLLAKKRGLVAEVLKYANSGDVSGDRQRVVGYSAILFYKPGQSPAAGPAAGSTGQADSQPVDGVAPLSLQQKKELLGIAEKTIKDFVLNGRVNPVPSADPRLAQPEGAFVTIHKNKQLRGCIGHIMSDQPLYKTVRDMAIAAASQDPRFPPLKKEELDQIDIEVSVLSQPRRCLDVKEIVMGKHGVIVRRDPFHQGVFLPQVAAETGWTREEFLSNLCSHKARLPPDAWKDPKTQIDIFTADVFSEAEVGAEP